MRQQLTASDWFPASDSFCVQLPAFGPGSENLRLAAKPGGLQEGGLISVNNTSSMPAPDRRGTVIESVVQPT